MKEIWERIENWLRKNCPNNLGKLNPPVSGQIINEAESIIGVEFPTDFKDFYKIHNGENEFIGLFRECNLFSFQDIIREWKELKEFYDQGGFEGWRVDECEEIENTPWNPKWIPFAKNNVDHFYLLDLTDTNKFGRIIGVFFEAETGRWVCAESFLQFVNQYANDLENGLYFYSEEGEAILFTEDFE